MLDYNLDFLTKYIGITIFEVHFSDILKFSKRKKKVGGDGII